MRGLAVLAALPLALAACAVNVEGAPCRVAGTAQDCPSGQACGNDGTCSERAAACTAPGTRCAPGETRCAGAGGKDRAEVCTGADPACGTWVATDCTSRGLECGTRSAGGAAACECPAFPGTTLAADPVAGSPSGAAPFPTGAASPSVCRFRRLGDALASAGTLAASGPATVRAYRADASQLQVVFGDAASGDGPVAIPANVTVAGATDAPTIFHFQAATTAPLVTLQGQLQTLRIEGVAASGAGVAISCGSARPSISDVAVDGGGAMAAGVLVSGGCGADLARVNVANVAGPALRVDADASAQVTVQGGTLRSSGVGARVTGGRVTFGVDGDATKAVEVSANAGDGVVVTTGTTTTTDARLYGAAIHGNGGTGVVVDGASAGSAITLRGCDVYSNGKGAPRTYGPGTPRPVGGVLVKNGPLPFTFAANRIYGNTGDQLAFESSATWSIAPTSCGASSNVFACVAGGAYAVAVAGGGTVDASYAVWPAFPFALFAGPGVGIATASAYCNGVTGVGVPPTPACPAP